MLGLRNLQTSVIFNYLIFADVIVSIILSLVQQLINLFNKCLIKRFKIIKKITSHIKTNLLKVKRKFILNIFFSNFLNLLI